MKITLNKEQNTLLDKVLATKENNIAINAMLDELCFYLNYFMPLKEAELNRNIENELIKELFFEYFELDKSNKENIDLYDQYVFDKIHLEPMDKYLSNPYLKSVNPQELEQNGYKLSYLKFPPYSFFPLDDIKVSYTEYYKEYPQISYFNKEYKYLTLSKNSNIWMSITPNEINTMEPHIKNAKGNVITFGLGLGYYPFMCSLKQDVNSITIVEKDDNIINLFNTYLLPFFPYKEKIKIIKDDVFTFLENNHLERYDYAFFDLWHNPEDGLPIYLKIRNIPLHCQCSYWLEDSIIAMYRRCFLTVMEESLAGYHDDDYRRAKNDIERVINEIYFKTKKLIFDDKYNFYSYLSTNNLIKSISKYNIDENAYQLRDINDHYDKSNFVDNILGIKTISVRDYYKKNKK